MKMKPTVPVRWASSAIAASEALTICRSREDRERGVLMVGLAFKEQEGVTDACNSVAERMSRERGDQESQTCLNKAMFHIPAPRPAARSLRKTRSRGSRRGRGHEP